MIKSCYNLGPSADACITLGLGGKGWYLHYIGDDKYTLMSIRSKIYYVKRSRNLLAERNNYVIDRLSPLGLMLPRLRTNILMRCSVSNFLTRRYGMYNYALLRLNNHVIHRIIYY